MRQPEAIATVRLGMCAVFDAMRLGLEETVAIERVGIRSSDRHTFSDERCNNVVPRCAESIGIEPHREDMVRVRVHARIKYLRCRGQTVDLLQAIPQPPRCCVASANLIGETIELGQKQRGLKSGQPGIRPKPDVLVPGAAGASPLVGD